MSSIAERFSTLNARLCELADLTGRRRPRPGPPATAADLAAVARRLGPLPHALCELLQAADGCVDLDLGGAPLRLFSTGELGGPGHAAFVAGARARHGFKGETALQKGLVFGGHDDAVLVVSEGPQKGRLTGMPTLDRARATHFSLRPPGIVVTGSLEQVLAVHTSGVERRLAEARTERPTRSPIDDAIEAFNYPEEMGEDVHDSVESLSAILAALPPGAPGRPAIELLLAALSEGYAGPMRFANARRHGDAIEVQYEGRWVDVTMVAPRTAPRPTRASARRGR